jgi:hypothetical protein
MEDAGCSGMNVDRNRTHFTPRKAKATYSNMSTMDLIYRCPGIILESLAFSSGQLDADHSTALPNVPGGKEE